MKQQTFIGVDVAKDWLDIHYRDRKPYRIDNAAKETKAFARIGAKEGAWINFEASGGCARILREALREAELRFSRLNPRQARHFHLFALAAFQGTSADPYEQGFTTEDGRFVGRKEAARLVKVNKHGEPLLR
jgi:transposase